MTNTPEPFVDIHSIVRAVWSDPDTILLVFAGSAAEFALNRAVDWLFFTGVLPRDPLGRLFATARFAQTIVFADASTAQQTMARIAAIHQAVEQQRGQPIPAWAYRDVLYMLIDYSERAYQILHRPLTPSERDDLYTVYYRVGVALHVPDLPATYTTWVADRRAHMRQDLTHSPLTGQLYGRYHDVLGWWRYRLLLLIQSAIVPTHVRHLLQLPPWPGVAWALRLYQIMAQAGLRPLLQWLFVPPPYLAEVQQLGSQTKVEPTAVC